MTHSTGKVPRIGPYRLEHELGQGGMGVVSLAERDDQFHHRVAVKIVRHGLDRPEMLEQGLSRVDSLAPQPLVQPRSSA